MKPLIAGNWKMHGDISWAEKAREFNALFPQSDRTTIDVLICPPFPLLASVSAKAGSRGILTGAQNCHHEQSGAHTGEVSADMLASVGASHVILGHSERRAEGEKSQNVKDKAKAALASQLIPIICVGESLQQREKKQAVRVVKKQLKDSCPEGEGYVVAYEPIWAIGTGKVPTSEDIIKMHDTIRKVVGEHVSILYGGSVKPGNATQILALPNVNGVLVGGASLKMSDFAMIAKSALPALAH